MTAITCPAPCCLVRIVLPTLTIACHDELAGVPHPCASSIVSCDKNHSACVAQLCQLCRLGFYLPAAGAAAEDRRALATRGHCLQASVTSLPCSIIGAL